LAIENTRGLKLGARAQIESNISFKLVSKNACIILGDSVFVGRNSIFDISQKLSIGDRVLIAPNCFITDHNHNILSGSRIVDQGITEAPVAIGDDAWIGANVCILPGVKIGKGAVIGAGAVVTQSIPDLCVAVGVPARVIRKREPC